jgi:hypothetical protein
MADLPLIKQQKQPGPVYLPPLAWGRSVNPAGNQRGWCDNPRICLPKLQSLLPCRPGEGRDPAPPWVPAFAGMMSQWGLRTDRTNYSFGPVAAPLIAAGWQPRVSLVTILKQ